MSCHVATLGRPRRCCRWTLGKSKPESRSKNFRFLACLTLIGFRGQNALIFPASRVSHNEFPELTRYQNENEKNKLLISLSTAVRSSLAVTFQFQFSFPFRFLSIFPRFRVEVFHTKWKTQVLNLWRKIWKLSQNTNADNEATFLMAARIAS